MFDTTKFVDKLFKEDSDDKPVTKIEAILNFLHKLFYKFTFFVELTFLYIAHHFKKFKALKELEITGYLPAKLNRTQLPGLVIYQVSLKSKLEKWKNFKPASLFTVYLSTYDKYVKNFKVYEDDVFIAGFMRSGTTLLQELVWMVVNNFDYETAKKTCSYNRCVYSDAFEYRYRLHGLEKDHIFKMKRPRCFKTHFPVQFLPHQVWTVKPRIIHICRDIKDVACSLYHYRLNLMHENIQSIEESFDDLLEDRIYNGPYREHVINWKNLPDYENILYLTYEELVSDMGNVIRRIGKFLNKSVTDEDVDRLMDYLSFEKMRKNPSTNFKHYYKASNIVANENRPTDEFIRKGKSGTYKYEMSKEYAEKFDKWFAEGANLKQGFNI